MDGKQIYDLTMQKGSMAYVSGMQTATFGYNGNILGPTLLMHKGDEVIINVTNQLGEPTTTHWHGLHLPAIMDGGLIKESKTGRSEEHTSELQSQAYLVCRLLLEKKNQHQRWLLPH